MVISILALAAAEQTIALNVNTILLAVIGLASAWITYRTAAISALQKLNAEELKTMHVAVNSGKTTMENELRDLRKFVAEQTGTIMALEENKRGAELARAVASAPPMMMVPSAPALVAVAPATARSSNPARATHAGSGVLEHAITELTNAAQDTVVAADKTVELAEQVPIKTA